MKVILTRDVKGLGRKNEVKDVPQGYAENFLVRNRYATIATPRAIADHEAKLRRAADEQSAHEELARETLAALDGKRVELKERANEQGHLFAKVHAPEIAGAIEAQLGPVVDAAWLPKDLALGEVGDHPVTVRVAGAKATLTAAVVAA
jgi:large subunit ribosomal protein L9